MKMIAKHLKLRIPSFQFQCYGSKDISTLPVSSNPPPPSKPHHSSLRRHVSSAFKTVGCGCGCHSKSNNSDEDLNRSPPRFNVAMALPPSPEKKKKKKKKRRLKKKKPSLRRRTSTSSAESGLFSSESFDEIDNEQDEEEEETETLVSSSKSISTDDSSSEFNPHLETIREKPYKKKKKKKKKISTYKKRKMKIKKSPSPENQSPARLSVFQRLIPCTVDGKVRESFAVVKKSEDPFEDFKRSMMEMIMEKQMFDEKDLEQLLHCLLSLNEKEHHGVIVEAFSEIWQSLFSRRSISRRSF